MVDSIYEIHRRKKPSETLIKAINQVVQDKPESIKASQGTLNALGRRLLRLDRLSFVVESGKGTLNKLLMYIKSGQNIVIDFGKYGADFFAYVFVSNIISRRLYKTYSEMLDMSEYPKLVVLLEEAHKFLDPQISRNTIFDRLAREMRKFNLILAMVDQRPSKIDPEILSQLANRFILSLTDPKDILNALTGPVDPASWRAIVRAMPPRTVLMFGDAIQAPTAMDVLNYNESSMSKKWSIETTAQELRESLNNLSDEEKRNMFKP
jgi:DNA helicase HerA-like ATPase